MTDSLSYDEILSHYEKYIRSNISIREYAKENGVSLTIYNWFKKFNLPVSTKRRRQKVYPDQQILTLHQEYLKSGLTISEFASQKTISKDTLAFRFRKLKLTIKPTSEHVRKYTVNHGYFNEIDTEEKAYFLGLLYADGCNVKGNNAVVLCLAEQDIDMLKRFATAIEFEFHGRPQIKHNNPNSQPMYRIEIYSKEMSDSLSRHGCMPQKTFLLQFPLLSSDLVRHFVRGYFDGDGSLSQFILRKDPRKTIQFDFTITSTKEMLESIGMELSNINVNYYIKKRHKNRPNNNFTLRVSGNQQIRRVCDWFYKDATVFGKRKYSNYLKLIELTNRT